MRGKVKEVVKVDAHVRGVWKNKENVTNKGKVVKKGKAVKKSGRQQRDARGRFI